MSQVLVAKRYAVALFQLAQEQNNLEAVEAELQEVKKALGENDKFLTIINHPKVSREKKKDMFKTAFKGVNDSVMNTLLVLVERQREDIIQSMVDYYVELANEARGVADATVYSIRELSDEEEKSLSDLFAKRIGKEKLRIKNVVDKSLLGGIKVRIGNTIYDGTVKRKLEQIERQLVSTK